MERVHGKYAMFWSWLIAYSVVFFGISRMFDGSIVLDSISKTVEIAPTIEGPYAFIASILALIGLILIWWRVIKVTVLQGSPFPFLVGLDTDSHQTGKEDGGRTGRVVTSHFIGNMPGGHFNNRFFYGSIFRSHPRSDKLVRSRLEYLLLTLPFNITLTVKESRLSFSIMDPIKRRNHFDSAFKKYALPSMEPHVVPLEEFHTQVVKWLEEISKSLEPKIVPNRIDGLNWYPLNDGGKGGLIVDDLGQKLEYWRDRDDPNRYHWRHGAKTGVGPFDAMRTYVQQLLTAIR